MFAQFSLTGADEQANRLKDLLEPDLLVLDDMFLARRITDDKGNYSYRSDERLIENY